MPYGDASVLATTAPWPAPPPRRRFTGLLPLILATVVSFSAGVGTTLVYLHANQDEIRLADAPLIEASKAPTRVRPEGLAENGAPLAAAPGAHPSSLPSPISSAMAMPPPVPAIDLAAQGIPTAPEIVPPARAEVIEILPEAPAPAAPAPHAAPAPVVLAAQPEPVSPPPAIAVPAGPETRLQVASWRSEEKAIEEMSRYKQVHAALIAGLEFKVERLDQGERGVFYRVLSSPVGERADGLALCAALAERRAQCQVLTLRAPVVETRVAVAPVPPTPPLVVAQPAPAPTAPAIASEPTRPEIRAQLATLRTFEGATRELNRLARVYGGLLERTELSVSRIDQGERGVFYRILTAPLPSRDAAGELCQRLGADYQAGCVLIPQRPAV